MKQFDFKLQVEPNGRIISKMVRLFNKYDSDISISKNTLERRVDGKSLIGTDSLSLHNLDNLCFYIDGRYEENDSIDLQNELKFIFLNCKG